MRYFNTTGMLQVELFDLIFSQEWSCQRQEWGETSWCSNWHHQRLQWSGLHSRIELHFLSIPGLKKIFSCWIIYFVFFSLQPGPFTAKFWPNGSTTKIKSLLIFYPHCTAVAAAASAAAAIYIFWKYFDL